MKIYLAARYTRREELCIYRQDLQFLGFVVTSRWLSGNHQVPDARLSEDDYEELAQRFAIEDFEDLMSADIVISFTEPPRSTYSRGGRHVEFGMALAAGKRVMVVGNRENVFHCMPTVKLFSYWTECLEQLEGGQRCCG